MNPKVEIKGNEIVITLTMQPNREPSASGKTLIVATTSGNVNTGVKDPKTNKDITIGVNAYVKNGN